MHRSLVKWCWKPSERQRVIPHSEVPYRVQALHGSQKGTMKLWAEEARAHQSKTLILLAECSVLECSIQGSNSQQNSDIMKFVNANMSTNAGLPLMSNSCRCKANKLRNSAQWWYRSWTTYNLWLIQKISWDYSGSSLFESLKSLHLTCTISCLPPSVITSAVSLPPLTQPVSSPLVYFLICNPRLESCP